ncbi:MAG TPA: GDP-mannose 4,6-dehydratase, partial [Actinomycetota bacterium]|nr:GDP-mannose 4,6-dehydratase [Actinomycetota bacterium]
VVATGVTHSVRELVALAFAVAEFDEWERYVRVDQRFFRPADVEHLVGDARKARELLGWAPSTTFEELVAMMVEHDIKLESDRAAGRR